ncbi:hypothetical protein [uncultured Desulfobacter sp.]|uniref:hypothetical protein n=1 Tax=uncultured Desulfobacter sp. TaxID=240139 RepID=UPI002AAAE5EB|nr:hypothetical protein [uncultured Desulfobacter sp.]
MVIALVNFRLDPGNIYLKRSGAGNVTAEVFADALIKSPNGLFWPNGSWDERDIKMALAKKDLDNVDCYVIGSSQIMQISSFRERISTEMMSESLINLGVSGATLEDYLAFSYVLTKKSKKPEKVLFGVSPWALDFGKDMRWQKYKNLYFSMLSILTVGPADFVIKKDTWLRPIVNLINPNYFLRSLKQIGKKKNIVLEAPLFDYSHGGDYPVLLPDAGLVYSSKHILDADSKRVPIGGTNYKIFDNVPPSSISGEIIFKKLICLLAQNGINVTLLMTPYHHNVWMNKKSVTTIALINIESKVRKIGGEIGVKVIGSYNPDNVGCNPDEFYDQMHPKYTCISTILHEK